MPDPRVDAVAQLVAHVEGAACRLARVATKATLAGGTTAIVLWWFAAGDRLTDWWQGTLASAVVLVLCVAPAIWLLHVRSALVELVELPETLSGVATRRAGRLRAGGRAEAPDGGLLGAVRSVRDVVRDYGDVVGSWGMVAQLLAPSFWLLTLAALAAVPVVVLLAASGLRGVPPAAVESSAAFGATDRQILTKVKLPLARDAIMLGVNQGIIMVLAVVVIGGLVGSGALGDSVARGLQRNEFGLGVVASLAILALGIALDRVTQGRRSSRDPRPNLRRVRVGRRQGP